jgi:hypothetical protein
VFLRMISPRQQLTPTAVTAIVYAACDRAGVPRVGAHCLRHTAASQMLRPAPRSTRSVRPFASGGRRRRPSTRRSTTLVSARWLGRGPVCGMSGLSTAVDDYLALRRALGHKMELAARLLAQFAAHCEQAEATHVTTKHAVAWASLPAGASAGWKAQRLGVVRGFAAWLQTQDARTQVPPADILPGRFDRAVPYPYSEDDIAALMAAAASLPLPLQRHTYRTLIGLLSVTDRIDDSVAPRTPDAAGHYDCDRQRPIEPNLRAATHVGVHVTDVQCGQADAGSSLTRRRWYEIPPTLVRHRRLWSHSARQDSLREPMLSAISWRRALFNPVGNRTGGPGLAPLDRGVRLHRRYFPSRECFSAVLRALPDAVSGYSSTTYHRRGTLCLASLVSRKASSCSGGECASGLIGRRRRGRCSHRPEIDQGRFHQRPHRTAPPPMRTGLCARRRIRHHSPFRVRFRHKL